MYREEDFLQLSGIQHFVFCRRQWALIHIEQQWEENFLTAEGRVLHESAHDPELKESRGNLISVRGMRVYSANLGISGECDVVEFKRDDLNGISINGLVGKYKVMPVEYKRGTPKQDECDIMQLCAQAICLEEMLCCEIPEGHIYYGETRRRLKVALDEPLRKRTTDLIGEMHMLYERRYTPKVRKNKSCNSCSLKNICLPQLNTKKASEYLKEMLETDQ